MADVMESASGTDRGPARLVRMFGWLMLAAMVAFLSNVFLSFYMGVPGLAPLVWGEQGEVGLWSWVQAAIYLALPLAAVVQVLRTPRRSLRADAKAVNDLNIFIVRAAFWAVLLVGVADIAISFMRVEGLLPTVFDDETARAMARSNFRGPYVHLPAMALGVLIACFTRTLGFHWLALMVVVAELLIVFSRFIFSYEQAFMADLVRLWYAGLFLFASAYTLLEDGHVRVDVLYAGKPRRAQGRVNAWGAILLGMTMCWTILLVGFWDRTSIINAPLLIFESTLTGFGMYVKYLMAGCLGVFAVTMMLQFVVQLFESVADMRGDPGGHEDHHVSHIA
ncbi:MAG TPA: TRAP transporter small permease subunit [Thermohalobaculum sp.]|nr:TRAP transporter small permease subunit [Thermohalobaculum sp.]